MDKLAKAILSGASKYASPQQIDVWAKVASDRYVRGGVEMNETIKKIAEDNGLNPEFITRVCEAANLQTHGALLPKESEKRASFKFPLAEPKAIIIQISKKDQGDSTLSDFSKSPDSELCARPSIGDMFKAPPQGDGGEGKKRLMIVIEKKAAELDRLKGDLLALGLKHETVMKKAASATRSHILQGEDAVTMHKAACLAGVGSVSKEMFPSIMREVSDNTAINMEKIALPVPENLINRDVPVKIVNGDHAVIAHLRTVRDSERDINCCMGRISDANDELTIYKRKLQRVQ